MRTATVSKPEVTRCGTHSVLRKISVSGPGQNASIETRSERGNLERYAIEHRAIGDVDDERIERRPRFDLEDARDGARIERIRSEPIDGFGWKSDDRAAL